MLEVDRLDRRCRTRWSSSPVRSTGTAPWRRRSSGSRSPRTLAVRSPPPTRSSGHDGREPPRVTGQACVRSCPKPSDPGPPPAGGEGGMTRLLDIMTSLLYTEGMPESTSQRSAIEVRQNRAAMRDAAPAVIALVASEVLVASLDLDAEHAPLARGGGPLATGTCGLADLGAVARGAAIRRVPANRPPRSSGDRIRRRHGGSTHRRAARCGRRRLERQWLQITFIGGILAWVAALAVRLRS